MDSRVRRSYNRNKRKFRFNEIHKFTKTKEEKFWDENMTEIIIKNKFPDQSKYYFELKPYKFYWFRCLLWWFERILRKIRIAIYPNTTLIQKPVFEVIIGVLVIIIAYIIMKFIFKWNV